MKNSILLARGGAIIAAMILGSTLLPAVASAQAPDTPQLAILDRYIGEWDLEMDSSKEGGKKTRGRVTAKWILNGRFIQQTSILLDDKHKPTLIITALTTFDAKAKKFRRWSFTSTGSQFVSEGTWDEAAATLELEGVGDDATGSMKITSTIDTEGHEEWVVEIQNETGDPTFAGGRNTRKDP